MENTAGADTLQFSDFEANEDGAVLREQFKFEMRAVFTDHAQLVRDLSAEVEAASEQAQQSFMENLWWEIVAEAKSALGTDAANNSSDDEAEQDEAIDEAENVVTDLVSHSSTEVVIAAAIWVWGEEEAAENVRDALK